MTVEQSAAARPVDPERRAHDHEHARLYDALEHAAQVAELAGHDILAASLRRDRRDVAGEIESGDCPERRR